MSDDKYLNYILESYLKFYPENNHNQMKYRDQEVQCLSRDGRVIHFLSPDKVSTQIVMLVKWLQEKELQASLSDEGFAHFISVFWITFISIHPFPDHNGKIAKQTVNRICQEFGKNISLNDYLDQSLIEGRPNKDLEMIKSIVLREIKKT